MAMAIMDEIMADKDNEIYTQKDIKPLFSAPKTAKILIIGQAPGIIAQETKLFWNDRSGDRLRAWMGIDRKTFYQSDTFAILPMDFYYPGKGKSGDLPPRKGFAEKWHPRIIDDLPNLQLVLLIGQYAQKFYLKDSMKKTVTETVAAYKDYLPLYFPLVHPSPRNGMWLRNHSWFEEEVVPDLRQMIAHILK